MRQRERRREKERERQRERQRARESERGSGREREAEGERGREVVKLKHTQCLCQTCIYMYVYTSRAVENAVQTHSSGHGACSGSGPAEGLEHLPQSASHRRHHVRRWEKRVLNKQTNNKQV